jgi:hypothetical protein
MKYVIIYLLLVTSTVYCQKVINHEIPQTGDIGLTPDIAIPKVNNGYTLWLPDDGKAKGLIVFTHTRRDTVNSDLLINYALQNDLAVLYAGTDNRLEFFFEKDKMAEIENYIYEVTDKYITNRNNLFFCGMSIEGTRALKLAAFSKSDSSKFHMTPKAIAICDSPLDMVRFHKEMIKAKELNFTPVTGNEGNWVSGYLESNLGVTPETALSVYIQYSPYSYSAEKGGVNINAFKDIYIRAYTEPDVNWWMETRRKDYYSMNSVDLAALVNELNILGNDNAKLIITHDKGYSEDGTRHPHNWSIVDEKELIDWFVSIAE